MVFIISLFLGLYLGFKLKGAIILYKETKNIKYIQEVVKMVLSNEEISLIKSNQEIQTEKDNAILEKEHKKIVGFKLRSVKK